MVVVTRAEGVPSDLSIGRVARITGLTADTIRVWEKRYQAVVPRRTKGGDRRYCEADVARLHLLSRAVGAGYAIGSVAHLQDPAILLLLDQRTPCEAAAASENPYAGTVSEYLHLITTMQLPAAQTLLRRVAMLTDRRELVFQVLLPMLREVGERWTSGAFGIHHEHAVSVHVRALLAIVNTHQIGPRQQRVVIATLSGEQHEFGALLACFLLRAQQKEVFYLGPDLPSQDIMAAVAAAGAEHVALSFISPTEPDALTRLRNEIDAISRVATVWCGMPAGHPLAPLLREESPQVRISHTLEDIEKIGSP